MSLAKLEEEVDARFGRGAAVSVDRRRCGIVVTVWTKSGWEILNAIGRTRDEAIRIAREVIENVPFVAPFAPELKVAS